MVGVYLDFLEPVFGAAHAGVDILAFGAYERELERVKCQEVFQQRL